MAQRQVLELRRAELLEAELLEMERLAQGAYLETEQLRELARRPAWAPLAGSP